MDGNQSSVSGLHLTLVDLDPSGEDGPLSGEESGDSFLLLDGRDKREDVGLGDSQGRIRHVDEEHLLHDLSTFHNGHDTGVNNSDLAEVASHFLLGGLDVVIDDFSHFDFNFSGFSLRRLAIGTPYIFDCQSSVHFFQVNTFVYNEHSGF